MRATIFVPILATALVLPTSGFADPLQTREDIVDFFANAIDLGAKRGICVGAEQECLERRAQETAAIPTGLDMLINFEFDSAQLTDDAKAKLSEFASALRDNRLRSHKFAVEGHTDASGTLPYNESLSERRARAVVSYLVSNGIEVNRLQPLGKGPNSPRAPDPYDAANRRVEMRIDIR